MGAYGLRAQADRRCLDLCDLDSLKWRDYALLRQGPLRWLYSLESRRVGELERALVAKYEATILITASEAQHLREQTGTTKIHVVANGADPDGHTACGPPAREPVIAFVGAMDYWPNEDAVCWFAREVWTELKRRVPAAEWIIVGRNPGKRVRRLGRLKGIEVTGKVPEVVSYLRGARVVIAPLRVARGLQNKILEGLAAGRPVVATPQAARGIALDTVPGLTVAGSRDDLLAALERLLKGKGLAEDEGRAARAWVGENFRWADRLEDLERIVAGPRVLIGRSAPADQVSVSRRWPIEVGA
jgi:sugar transferase (PEP-CTERM/EpsH1 system associated)